MYCMDCVKSTSGFCSIHATKTWASPNTQPNSKKAYLGDSVYAQFDGYHVILTTENEGNGNWSNRIALEPSVLRALYDYASRFGFIEFDKENKNGL